MARVVWCLGLLLMASPAMGQGAEPVGAEDGAPLGAATEGVADSWRPAVMEYSEPVYPADAMRRGLEGVCEVRLRVDQAGYAHIEQMRCSAPEFETPTRAALAQWRFTPWPGPEPLSVRLLSQPVRYQLD